MSTKTVRFYSQEEYNALKQFIEKKKSFTLKDLAPFCKKFSRAPLAAQAYIYSQRKKFGNIESVKPLKVKKSILKSSEFHIPITKWELLKVQDKFTLVLKF